MYFAKIVRRFFHNAPLRLQLTSMAVSTTVYAVSILLLNDGDRGALTAFLYASYLIVGLAFFGSNTMIAYWEKAPYHQRIRLSVKVSKPGLASGLLLVLGGTIALQINPNTSNHWPLMMVLLGFLVFLSTLGETIFSAKTSSEPRVPYWQHYGYFITFLVSLGFLIATNNLGVSEIILAYLIASIFYLFAPWFTSRQHRASLARKAMESQFERLSAAKLFFGTFSASMQIRVVSLAVVALHGTEYLGKYLVLWLAFEVVEQLYRFVLLTEVHNIRGSQATTTPKGPWVDLKHVTRIGVPGILIVGLVVFFVAPHIITITMLELSLSLAFLTLNYLGRLVFNYRLNHLQATRRIGLASKLSIWNTALAISLVSVFPIFLGFPGIAVALAMASIVSLLVSIQKLESRVDVRGK